MHGPARSCNSYRVAFRKAIRVPAALLCVVFVLFLGGCAFRIERFSFKGGFGPYVDLDVETTSTLKGPSNGH